MKRDLYALHDREPTMMFRVTPESAPEWNQKGYGIFWTVNEFTGRRKGQNLKRLNSWYVEIDEIDKAEQMALIEASPVPPNLIIESKRGFQIYWNCREAGVENYGEVLKRLRAFFCGDDRAKDTARVLRAPGYLHLKNPDEPFHVSVVWDLEGTYTERLMLYNFPPVETDEAGEMVPSIPYARKEMQTQGDDFWEKAASLDCEEALKRLSGTSYVNGEVFSFQPSGAGKLNIVVNGKGTSCWIDANKRIGSSSKGGPTVARWLAWYGHSYREIYRILREAFPELQGEKK